MNKVTKIKKENVKGFVKKYWKTGVICAASVACGYLIGEKMTKKNYVDLKIPKNALEELAKVEKYSGYGHLVTDSDGLFKLNELGKLCDDVLNYEGNKIPEDAVITAALILTKKD